MQTLYDSDSFVVVHTFAHAADPGDLPLAVSSRQGFEIVDKRSNKEVYLHGPWAELFQRKIDAWREAVPTQAEVEQTLDGYAELAQTPLVMH